MHLADWTNDRLCSSKWWSKCIVTFELVHVFIIIDWTPGLERDFRCVLIKWSCINLCGMIVIYAPCFVQAQMHPSSFHPSDEHVHQCLYARFYHPWSSSQHIKLLPLGVDHVIQSNFCRYPTEDSYIEWNIICAWECSSLQGSNIPMKARIL